MSTIFITGVSQRLGFYLADYYLSQGDTVVGTFRTERDAITELKKRGADLYQLDFYDPKQTQQLIDWLLTSYAEIDCVIHNASDWSGDTGELNYTDYADVFQRMMTIHAEVPYQLNMALAPVLNTACSAADIIHITDYVAFKGSKKHVAYAASKAALESLTLSFAQRFAPRIKVNSIAPALLAFNEWDDDDYKNKARAKSLMQSEGSFQEALNAIIMLTNSNYITGRVIHLDGGRHLK